MCICICIEERCTLFLNHIWCALVSVELDCGPHLLFQMETVKNPNAMPKQLNVENKKETKRRKKHATIYITVKYTVLIVVCALCYGCVLYWIALQCATQQHSDRHLFFIWFAIKNKNKSKCASLKNEWIWCVAATRTSWCDGYTLRAWINLKNLELELKWESRRKEIFM